MKEFVNKTMYKMLVAVVIVGSVLTITMLCSFSLQKHLATKHIGEYVKAQGIDARLIGEKESYRDWKNGGYVISVKYTDDPPNRYYYNYRLWTKKSGGKRKWHVISLDIINEDPWIEIDEPYEGKCLHPPLHN